MASKVSRRSFLHMAGIAGVSILAACGGQQATAPTTVPAGNNAPAATNAGATAAQATAAPAAGGPTATLPTATPQVFNLKGANAGAKEITFWTTHGPPDIDTIQRIAQSFIQQNPDISIKLVRIAGSDVTDVSKLMTAVRGGVGPDVYMLDRFIVAQRAADGLLQDLSQFSGGTDPLANYIDFARAEASLGGKPYALPFDTDTRAIFYNKGLLKDAGVNPDDLDPKNGPLTWDKFKEIANKFNKKQGNTYTAMGFVPWFDQGGAYTYGFSFGGTFFDPQKCEVTPTDPKIMEAFTWVQNYAKELGAEQAQAFVQSVSQPGQPPQQHAFLTKQIAFDLTGDWMIGTIKQYTPDLDYGVTYLPVAKQGDKSVTWAGGWSVVMPQGAKQPEAAWKFMQYFAGETGQRVYTKETTHLPTIKSLTTDKSLFDERHVFFADLLALAKNRPPLPVGALYWDELQAAFQKDYLAQGQPDALLTDVKNRVQARLQPQCAKLKAS